MAEEITVKELKEKRDDILLIDCREPHEQGKIPGSVNIPLSKLKMASEIKLPKDKEIVVHCRSGKRSQMAADILIEKGYKAKSLKGGILEWEEE